MTKLSSQWFGPYRITKIHHNTVTVRASPTLGGEVQVGFTFLKKFQGGFETDSEKSDEEDLEEENHGNLPNDENVPFGMGDQAQIPTHEGADLEVANAQEHEAVGYYIVESILKHKFSNGYYFLTKWENFPICDSTWEPIKQFVLPNGSINPALQAYCSEKRLHTAWRKALALSDRKKGLHLTNTITV